MESNSPQVSIIIPTYNGAKRIGKTLKTLAIQGYSAFELVVVIDGSTDATEEIVKESQSQFPFLKIISQENKGRSGAKNNGAFEAAGNLLIFYDDDLKVKRNSIKKHLDIQQKYQSETIISGNVVEPSMQSEFSKFRAHLRSTWISRYSELGMLNEKNLYLTAANFSISKKLFQELNGFDESFSDGEDFDLAIRAFKKGVKIYFDKSNVAFHEDQATVRSYIERRRQYEKAREQLSKKHPDFVAPLKRSFLKKTIYFLFSFELWVIAIEKGYLKFLPQKIRYKIYTLTIWGLSQYFPNKKLS